MSEDILTVEREGGGATLHLDPPAKRVTRVVECYLGTEGVELDSDDYRRTGGGRVLRRLGSGSHPAEQWGRAEVEYIAASIFDAPEPSEPSTVRLESTPAPPVDVPRRTRVTYVGHQDRRRFMGRSGTQYCFYRGIAVEVEAEDVARIVTDERNWRVD